MAVLVVLLAGLLTSTTQATTPVGSRPAQVPADEVPCSVELPGGRCAVVATTRPADPYDYYRRVDYGWVPQPRTLLESRLLTDALRIPALLREACRKVSDQSRNEAGEGYMSYVVAQATLLRLIERTDGRRQLSLAFTGRPALLDPGMPHGSDPNAWPVADGSYQACLDRLAPHWRLPAPGQPDVRPDTVPGWRQVVADLLSVPKMVGQPGTDGGTFCHNDDNFTDWDFTMALVMRAWGLMKNKPSDVLGMNKDQFDREIAERAWLQGGPQTIDHRVCTRPGVPETENHTWGIRTTRFLHNEHLPMVQPAGEGPFDPAHKWTWIYYGGDDNNNRNNGMTRIILDTIGDKLTNDWLEYNARPYTRYQMIGLLNLYDFAKDTEVRQAAGELLNFMSIKHAAESMDNQKIVPFRRIRDDDNANLYQGSTTSPMYQVWAGGLPEPRFPDGSVAEEMMLAAGSDYRLPDWIVDMMVNRTRRDYLQRFDGRFQHEIAYGGPDFVLTGGGESTNCPYLETIGGGVEFCFGSGNDYGTVEPIVLIPRRNATELDRDTTSFPTYNEFVHVDSRPTAMVSCVDYNFACGGRLHIPDNVVKQSPGCRTTIDDQPELGPPAVVLRFDVFCSPATAPAYNDDCFFVYARQILLAAPQRVGLIDLSYIVTHSCSPTVPTEAERLPAFHAFINYMRTVGRPAVTLNNCSNDPMPPPTMPQDYILTATINRPPPATIDLTGVTTGIPIFATHGDCPPQYVIGNGQYPGEGHALSGDLTMTGGRYPTTTAQLSSTSDNKSYYQQPVPLVATITPAGGRTGAGGTVTFFDGTRELGTVPVTATAGGAVQATLTTSTLGVGTHRILASYSGDSTFVPSIADLEQTVLKAPTRLAYTGVTTAPYHEAAALAATLTNAVTNTPIPAATVDFRLNDQESCSQQTSDDGNASCTVIPNEPAGDYPLTVSYGGHGNFELTNLRQNFTVTKEKTALAYTGTTHLANATPARLSAVLKEDGILGKALIEGRTVDLALGSGATAQRCTAVTDATGTAECTIASIDQPLTDAATVPITAIFASDPYYLASSAEASLRLQFATGRAYGVSAGVHLPLLSVDLLPTPDTGPVRTAHAGVTAPCAGTVLDIVLSARALCENVTTTLNPGTSTATSTLEDASIGVLGLPVITVSGVTATSTSTCGSATGTTTIGRLTIGGVPVTIPTAPNSAIDLGGGARLVVNEQTPVAGADHGLTVNAIHLTAVAGAVDVVLGATSSGAHNCAPGPTRTVG